MPWIITILLIGALLGLVFAKKGKEKEGVWSGLKTAAGCALLPLFLAIIFIIVIVVIFVTNFS